MPENRVIVGSKRNIIWMLSETIVSELSEAIPEIDLDVEHIGFVSRITINPGQDSEATIDIGIDDSSGEDKLRLSSAKISLPNKPFNLSKVEDAIETSKTLISMIENITVGIKIYLESLDLDENNEETYDMSKEAANKDHTGPEGKGPMTGRGKGECSNMEIKFLGEEGAPKEMEVEDLGVLKDEENTDMMILNGELYELSEIPAGALGATVLSNVLSGFLKYSRDELTVNYEELSESIFEARIDLIVRNYGKEASVSFPVKFSKNSDSYEMTCGEGNISLSTVIPRGEDSGPENIISGVRKLAGSLRSYLESLKEDVSQEIRKKYEDEDKGIDVSPGMDVMVNEERGNPIKETGKEMEEIKKLMPQILCLSIAIFEGKDNNILLPGEFEDKETELYYDKEHKDMCIMRVKIKEKEKGDIYIIDMIVVQDEDRISVLLSDGNVFDLSVSGSINEIMGYSEIICNIIDMYGRLSKIMYKQVSSKLMEARVNFLGAIAKEAEVRWAISIDDLGKLAEENHKFFHAKYASAVIDPSFNEEGNIDVSSEAVKSAILAEAKTLFEATGYEMRFARKDNRFDIVEEDSDLKIAEVQIGSIFGNNIATKVKIPGTNKYATRHFEATPDNISPVSELIYLDSVGLAIEHIKEAALSEEGEEASLHLFGNKIRRLLNSEEELKNSYSYLDSVPGLSSGISKTKIKNNKTGITYKIVANLSGTGDHDKLIVSAVPSDGAMVDIVEEDLSEENLDSGVIERAAIKILRNIIEDTKKRQPEEDESPDPGDSTEESSPEPAPAPPPAPEQTETAVN